MILDEVGSLLVANASGVSGQTLFLSRLPEMPDDAVALYEYPGEGPFHIKGQKEPILEFPRVQVLSRSKSYQTARNKAENVYRLLDGYSGSLSGIGYARISALHSPMFLNVDDSNRVRIVCNFRVMKELSALPP